jgi:hypothetical protein
MFYSGEEAISDIKNNFAFYASDMFTSWKDNLTWLLTQQDPTYELPI